MPPLIDDRHFKEFIDAARAHFGESCSVPHQPLAAWAMTLTFDFCLSTSIPVLTTSTRVVAWPQGGQFLGGDCEL